jgi:hypothetical protein
MFLYKKIEFSNVETITEKLLRIAQQNNPELQPSMRFDYDLVVREIPELHNQLIEKNLNVEIFREFVSQPFNGINIHVDGSKDHPKYLALNWPILNCANTKMVWWHFDAPPKLKFQTHDAVFPTSSLKLYSPDGGTVINSAEITEPTLVNIAQYHSIVNGPLIRRMVSFRFKTEPCHLLNDNN